MTQLTGAPLHVFWPTRVELNRAGAGPATPRSRVLVRLGHMLLTRGQRPRRQGTRLLHLQTQEERIRTCAAMLREGVPLC
ncbi:hypothetical protein [Ruania albidiflava]|uniref:hypothetical protein n=1 Tax=Ruania albidiflava TaxID=366586 RepID=UPI0003B5A07A|nr:hypothetical protein [Ruania albidiflava]